MVGLHKVENDADSDSTMLDNSEQYEDFQPRLLPDHELLILEKGDSPASLLEKMAIRCKGLSGRALAALPQDSLSLYSNTYPCPILDALAALEKGILEASGSEQLEGTPDD